MSKVMARRALGDWVRPLVVAVLLYIAAFLTRDVLSFGNLAEQTFDEKQALLADQAPASVGKVFVDFDQEQIAALGYPPIIPPQVVLKTSADLATRRPRLLIIDIDISTAGGPDVEKALRALDAQGAPVLLAREAYRGREDSPPFFRPSPLEAIVSASRNLMWVSVVAPAAKDGVVRRMSPWVNGCVDGKAIRLPSPALAAILVRSEGDAAGARRVFGAAGPKLTAACPSQTAKTLEIDLGYGERRSLGPSDGFVRYTESWPPKPARVAYMPARLISPKADLSAVEDAIVVVATSAPDRRDLHTTPLDEMPGGYILLNAIAGALDHGLERPSGFLAGLCLVLAITILDIVVVGVAFSRTPARWRPMLKTVLPTVLTGLLWLGVLLSGSNVASGLLLVIQFTVSMMISAAEARAKSGQPVGANLP
ncbi:CHASE2 domain-containing protein [Caulobacter vibrioides]|uniref:CHASE2 domain-containing protein n=1 Tax=Caulobacter vibrioides TaxID=155892 RepID=A0A290MQS5_CAUVI|nr:CHASE2 domain-containing protein [Caulobacter vibrioides]ATC32180.1 CHASE2 domain-containing protein [Caulobacter vibrioides]